MLIQFNRKKLPELLGNEIIGVQPMKGDLTSVLKIKPSISIPIEGERIHDFIKGFLRYYGNEYISESLWIKIKIAGY